MSSNDLRITKKEKSEEVKRVPGISSAAQDSAGNQTAPCPEKIPEGTPDSYI